MLTGKQKVFLRGLANGIKPVMQIGKGGLNEELIIAVLQYLNKHELMKVSILQNSDTTWDELDAAFSSIDVEVVQKIGKTIVSYKHSDNVDDPIKLPVKKEK